MPDKLNRRGDMASFRCPGCKDRFHEVRITGPNSWGWNGSLESPTFTSSVLMTSGHYGSSSPTCWCTYNAAHPDDPSSFICERCHSFVRDGKIQFLADCSHSLAGQTVEIPDWNSDF
jgi:hypothetical protein